jgi:hypothetical protein
MCFRRHHHASRITHRASRLGLAIAFASALSAAEVDVTKLPLPATNKIDYLRDIKPILDQACLKCHGPEKPKSKFRIDDRDALLKGGENGVDVKPGHSAASPLIHYVARLVEDMEMPPPGKGDPLTAEQIGLLRAWIDQGVPWAGAAPTSREEYEIVSTVGWTGVKGNQAQFREHYWQPEGWNGGLERYFFTEQLTSRDKFTVTGRALRDDYKVTLSLERPDFGFARGGWEQYRKYFNDAGGYYALSTPPITSLGQDLHLDTGRAWAEVGLTLPRWPQVVLGYEYQYQDGEKSILQWLPTTESPLKRILPNAKSIDQQWHVIRLDLSHDFGWLQVADNFRYEFFNLDTSRGGALADLAPGPRVVIQEGHDAQQWANALRLEKQLTDWWLLTGGYLYTHADGEASFNQATFNAAGQFTDGYFWRAQPIIFHNTSQTLNLNTLLGPWQGFSFSAGLLSEWARQEGMGNAQLDFAEDADPNTFTPATLDSNLDRFTLEENFLMRFTRIPFTVLFADGRFRQEEIGQFEEQLGGNQYAFMRDTDARHRWYDVRGGFRISPWQRLSLNAHYRYRDRDNHYDQETDQLYNFFGQPIPGLGYPAFITARQTYGDEVEAKLVWRPLNWLKTTFSYKLVATDYETTTEPVPNFLPTLPPLSPGGQILAGTYDAHFYSVNAALTPWRRFSLSGTFTYTDTRTVTAANNVPEVVPYPARLTC